MKVNQSGGSPVQASEASSAKASQQIKKNEKSSSSGRNERVSTGDSKTEISSRGKEFAKAREVAAEAPDVREDKVSELKQRISSGAYKVDSHAIADRLVDEHLRSS
jgi:negative regulator of flagellin synthesis FlgM